MANDAKASTRGARHPMKMQEFRASIPRMAERPRVHEMETMFMALADRTRLRLLNLMADDEVCVNFFTEALGESQPKVSRHLAYLRNTGIVDTRREGKWIYYSIRRPASDALYSVLDATLAALAGDPELAADRARLSSLKASPVSAAETADLPYRVESDHEPPPPRRPVHNELDEFLL